jgi:hypothetical protein
MAKDDLMYNRFIEVLKERIPEKGKLANDLTDYLGIEKEAIYRRLRGDVPFSFSEITRLALKYAISLDSIAEGANPSSRPFNIQLSEFLNPSEEYYAAIENFTINIKSLANDLDSELGYIATMIPVSLCISYKPLFKFYVYKWYIQFRQTGFRLSYTDIKVDSKLDVLNEKLVYAVRNFPNSVYIFDELFIFYLADDIKYFEDINLLKRDEIMLIKESLHLFLSDLERYAINGRFDDGGKMFIYISNVHFENNFNYVDSKHLKLSMIKTFTLNEIYTVDEKICEGTRKWCLFLKRASTLISQSGELKRIEFFDKQRKIVDDL